MSDDGGILIPFGVTARWKGRGLGLAALVQRSAIGIPFSVAQLLAKPKGGRTLADADVVETMLPPQDWTTLRGKGDAPLRARWVITGSFHPPDDEAGQIRLYAYDAQTEKPAGAITHWIEEDSAAADLGEAFDRLFADAGLGKAGLAGLGDLSWEPLDLLLLGEASQTPHPLRGGARDPLTALVCFERALSLRTGSRYLAGRLAALAGAIGLSEDHRGGPIAERALARALEDAPDSFELHEATAVLALERLDFASSEKHTLDAIASDASQSRAYALLAESRRRGGDLAGAESALDRGFAIATDPFLLHQRAILFRDQGRTLEARGAWEAALAYRPLFEPAFERFSELALVISDAVLTSQLVDRVLEAPEASPSVLRVALKLLDAFEPPSLARAAKEKRLAERYVDRLPNDAHGHMILGNAERDLGNRERARASYAHALRSEPGHAEASAALAKLNPPPAASAEKAGTTETTGDGKPALTPLARFLARFARKR